MQHKLLLLISTIMATATHSFAALTLVATTTDLASIAKAVGGDHVTLTTLARPTEDPHFVDAKPSFIVKLNRADLLLHGGAELETGWLPALLAGARNEKLLPGGGGNVPCNEGVAMLEIPATLDRSQGDIHASGNPHYAIDPENAKIIARNVGEALARSDPAHAGEFRSNATAWVQRLDRKITEWKTALAPFQGAHIVSYHNSWIYFGRCFGLLIDLHLEPKPGIPPSPAHLAEITGKIRLENARVIIVDPYLNRKTAETVARNTGAIVVDVSQFPGGLRGTEDDYIALIDRLIGSLTHALQNKP